MALTLECICSPDASICTLTQLIYHVNAKVTRVGTIGALNVLTLFGSGGSYSTLANPEGEYYINLSPIESVVSDWGSLSVSLLMDASLFQVPEPRYSQFQGLNIVYGIIQKYECQNLITGSVTTLTITSNTSILGPHVDCDGGTRGYVDGGISSMFYLSTPLGDCLSGALVTTDSDFEPAPYGDNLVNIGDSSHICLCATGGSGSYSYSIVSGLLPCGVTLNQETGCLIGEYDGTCPGTTSITFRVTDNGGGDQASTGGVTIGGTCRTFGTGVTRISGGAWDSSMIGNSITIDGGPYTVSSVTAPDNMTISASAGILNPTAWSYTSPVIPPPPPGPPETAEVTCGFVATCPTSDTGLGGNSAY